MRVRLVGCSYYHSVVVCDNDEVRVRVRVRERDSVRVRVRVSC